MVFYFLNYNLVKDKQKLVDLIGRSSKELLEESRMGFDSPEFRTLEHRIVPAQRGLQADREAGRLGFRLKSFLQKKLGNG